jgi:ferredoxin
VKLSIDAARCTGHGRCYSLAPAVFGEDEHGHSVLRLVEIPPEHQRAARIAVANCPEDALEISGE